MDLQSHILTCLIFLPAAGALVIAFLKDQKAMRWTALSFALGALLLSLIALGLYDFKPADGIYAYDTDGPANPATPWVHPNGVVQLVHAVSWIPQFNIEYRVGTDGLSLPLVILTCFIFVLAIIASWNIEKMTKGYMVLFLLLQTGILGTFLALDFFLFYVFFEISLLPMYFLIGIWGGPRQEYAAIKFFLYTLAGSVALLIMLIGTYLNSRGVFADLPGGTFDLVRLASSTMTSHYAPGSGLFAAGKALFLLAMFGFLVKLPAVPLHSWLPDAHVEAPTPVSMVLAGVLLKMGGYGIFRIAYPLFGFAAREEWMLMASIGVLSILYGAFCAMGQRDFKRLVAYSSISHMGFVILGAALLTEAGTNGAIFMMVAHGITSAAMFFIVGVAYDRAKHREISRFGGLATTMPVFTGYSTVLIFAALGLPGLCGFWGEILVLLGAFRAAGPGSVLMKFTEGHAWGSIITLAVLACTGVIWTAAYMLWMMQRIYLGPERPEYKGAAEVTRQEQLVLAPLALLAVLLGILPTALFFTWTSSTVAGWFRLVSGG